jgi:hypothetical protein
MPHPKAGYKVDGKPVPGVTTVLSRFKDSGGLLHWAFAQGKLAEQGVIENLYDNRDSAGEAGTLCHLLVENHIRGISESVEKNYTQEICSRAFQGYQNYLSWEKNNNLKVVYVEEQLISRKYLFGGTMDCIFEDADGVLSIGDFKTSNSIFQDYLLQIAAYKLLWEELRPEQPINGGFHLLRFSKEHADFAHHFWSELKDAERMFLLLREAYDLDKKLKKRI